MKQVLIVQTLVKQYRVSFFEKLYQALDSEGIKLRVAYGDPSQAELQKSDNVELNSEVGLKVKNYWLFKGKILYQPLWKEIQRSDLIIVEQASRHVINYVLLVLSALKLKKVAFWGHGWDRQAEQENFQEWVKRKVINRVDWWFAYTEGTAQYLREHNVRKDTITIVQNSIDTQQLQDDLLSITANEIAEAKAKYQIEEPDKIGLFCGGLYPNKHWRFLIYSGKLIHEKIPNFKLFILGNGPDRQQLEQIVSEYPWMYYVGSQFEREKALYFSLADVFLIPGLVGLAILDAFVAGLPVITTDLPIHSPEIEYLSSGINGVMTEHSIEEYAQAVIKVMNDHDFYLQLKTGALITAKQYTIEQMVDNFKTGILKGLSPNA
ncbi:glycosyltransferase family 4 protein [Limnoraphis robusta]|uniref:Glycosyltransferase family 4 protein n=1 Tax=Limnoraphis robusta CCNP1315 TaxID=3110306 RepID=A0ABU5TW70_9CYAN|nr:glycosyltransferase family 4 protein [Limnoraphis robusta]MEA5519146.1 glycosyltransferase family 4 protein [Limnoraphis robusta CCNP1315]MEA5548129.1 glycosyltransferase family 4 protein [Limnoraphis robusta CCNP1324]